MVILYWLLVHVYICIFSFQAFHIQVPESESEEEQSESESESQPETSGVGAKDSHQPPTMDEIDSVLGYFRRDAEVRMDTSWGTPEYMYMYTYKDY